MSPEGAGEDSSADGHELSIGERFPGMTGDFEDDSEVEIPPDNSMT